uniref:Uncharacterized protein n=1 Tax=Lepidosiren paradoxus TaxID=7883 RepID=A0A1S5VGW3_LEPPA|nr:hypothetical protein [Lepidosiren paradoxa]
MVREQGELYNVEQEIKKLKARKDDREVEKSRLEQRQTGSVQMDWGDNAEKLKRTDYDIVMNKNQDNDRFSSDESQERNDFNQEGSIRLPTLYIAGIPKPRVESSYLLKVTVYNILKSLLHEKIKWSDIMSSYRYRVPPARGKICVVVKNNSLKQIILEKGSLLVDCGVRISDSLSSFQQGEQNDEEQEQKSSSKQKPVNQQRITKCLVQNGEITHVDEYRPSSGNGRGKRNKNKRVNTFLEKKSETSYRSDLVMSTRVELSSTYTT